MKVLIVLFCLTMSIVFSQAPTVLPAEAILFEPIALSDFNSNSATLELGTKIPVACLVVFGEDENFGSIALDQDMGADAHEHHRVVMRDLKPDTVYYYRLQGSDRNGNFYASQIMSFRSAKAEVGVDLGTNVASSDLGAVISNVSSNFGAGSNDSSWGANNAIDGQARTEWSSNSDGNGAFITVTLPEVTDVSGFGLWTRTMGTSAEISSFTVTNELGEEYGPFDISDASQIYDFPIEGKGQSFTFQVMSSNGGNTGAIELAIYKK